VVLRRADFVRHPTSSRRRDLSSLRRRSFEARSSPPGAARERRRGDRIRLFAYFPERKSAIGELLPGIGETFTEIAETFTDVGEPRDDIGTAFTHAGETFTHGGRMFTHVGLGFSDAGKKSEESGGGLTEHGKNFEDGGTQSFDRRRASSVGKAVRNSVKSRDRAVTSPARAPHPSRSG
jgi:hypothetical protein